MAIKIRRQKAGKQRSRRGGDGDLLNQAREDTSSDDKLSRMVVEAERRRINLILNRGPRDKQTNNGERESRQSRKRNDGGLLQVWRARLFRPFALPVCALSGRWKKCCAHRQKYK